MTIERSEPATDAGERAMLEGWLAYHRETLAWKCEGLDDTQLRTASVEPSELSLLGLVRHMAEVERSWFRKVLVDDAPGPIYYSEEDRDGEFHLTEETPGRRRTARGSGRSRSPGRTRRVSPWTRCPWAGASSTTSPSACGGSTPT